jgi:hypothetical protein
MSKKYVFESESYKLDKLSNLSGQNVRLECKGRRKFTYVCSLQILQMHSLSGKSIGFTALIITMRR